MLTKPSPGVRLRSDLRYSVTMNTPPRNATAAPSMPGAPALRADRGGLDTVSMSAPCRQPRPPGFRETTPAAANRPEGWQGACRPWGSDTCIELGDAVSALG
jgi:hypothetical protein